MKAIEKAGAATAECAMSAPKRLFAAICALLLAAMLVPTVGTQQAQAAEAKYSGNIIGVDTFAEHSLIAGKTNHGSTLSFMPVEGYEEFVAVPENERLSSEKWTAVSSNPSVLEATVSKSDDLGCTLNVKALAVGTATLTVTYEYGNWSAERSCEVIVLAQENKAASFTLNVNSITVPILANCPECGKVHQLAGIYSGAGALKEGVDYTITAQDPSAPLSSYYIQATSSSFAPAASGWVGGSNAITFGPEKVGSGKVTLQIVGLPSGYEDQVWQEATIDVTAENQNPTIEFDADKVTLYKGYSNLLMSYMTPNEAAEAVVFQHDLTLQSLIAEASSSNNDVVQITKATSEGVEYYQFNTVGVGSATVTVKDRFGQTHSASFEVQSVADADLSSLKFVQNEMTLAIGERTPDFMDLVADSAYEDLSGAISWNLRLNDFEGAILKPVTSNSGDTCFEAVGAGTTTFELLVYNPDDPSHPIVADTMTVTVKGPQVAATASDSAVSATAEANNIATINAIAAAKQEHGDLVLVANPDVELTDAAREAVVAMATGDTRIAGQFDIHFATTAGQEVVVNKNADGSLSMTVRIAMTDAMKALDPDTLKVWYVSDDGKTEEKTTWVEDGSLCFTTEHFSTYVVTGEPQSEPAGDDVKKATALAQTGDATPLAASVAGAAALCALAAFSVTRRKLG